MSLLESTASISYGVSAAAYALLGIYLVVVGGSGLLRNHFCALALAGLAWSVFGAATAGTETQFWLQTPGFIFDALFLGSWFALLYRLLRGPYRKSMPETVRRALYLYWAVLSVLALIALWLTLGRDSPLRAVAYHHVVVLGIALACFALAAQLKKDKPLDEQRALLAFAVAAALISGVQILVLGVAMLAGSAPALLASLRPPAAAIAVLIVLYGVARRPQWSLAIFVLPQARAYAPRLLSMLALLFVLLAAVPLTRALPLVTTQGLTGGLIAIIGFPMALLLYSEMLSARVRVFISKHFLPFRYDYREEWLRLIDTLAAPDQRLPLPERAIKALAQIVSSPAGVLWLRKADEGPFHCMANWNTTAWRDEPVASHDAALAFMLRRQWILDTAELRRDPGLYEGLRRPLWLEQFPDALLIVPLISSEELIGFIVLFQSSSAFRLTFEEIDLLRTSGRQVAAHLAQYQADQQLVEAQQFEAFNRLTAFVMHDLKNLIAQQSLMVKNAARHKGNPQFFEDAMATIENSVARMNKLLRQLQRGEPAGPRQRVRLSDALREAIEKSDQRKPEPGLVIDANDVVAEIDRERFTTIIAHLIRNAQEATVADGHVAVSLRTGKDGRAQISIEDDGCGMDAEFLRTRLFRPFDSTKGSQGMGIGAYQARTFVTESGGDFDVRSARGEGTKITISLPVWAGGQ